MPKIEIDFLQGLKWALFSLQSGCTDNAVRIVEDMFRSLEKNLEDVDGIVLQIDKLQRIRRGE